MKRSPACGTSFNPVISTGVDGPAVSHVDQDHLPLHEHDHMYYLQRSHLRHVMFHFELIMLLRVHDLYQFGFNYSTMSHIRLGLALYSSTSDTK